MNYIDYLLDRITMYRLVLYILIGLILAAAIFSFFGSVDFPAWSIIFSSLFLVAICYLSNKLIAKLFKASTNNESSLITALILSLIMSPAQSFSDLPFLFLVAVLAMGSKYILAIRKKHLFNPAAVASLITLFTLGQSASWWVGTTVLAPLVLIGGFLIIRKLRFWALIGSFLILSLGTSVIISLAKGDNILNTLSLVILHSSLLFVGSIMLTEPLTLPPTKNKQLIYGAIVGFLSAPQLQIGAFFFVPELALCIGNLFSYLVSPKTKLILFLEQKIQVSKDVMEFVFKPSQKLAYLPGQYMEWTLPHKKTDSRGNRRFFTVASSPTEDTIRLGVKFYPDGSSFKKALGEIDSNLPIIASQLAGEFTLPKNKDQKLVFIAGGIGITPYRSMIKYLIDEKEKRDIVLFYISKTKDEIAYKDIFDQARKLGIKTIYCLTDKNATPKNWSGKMGRLNQEMIKEEVPDFKDRKFYLSGPQNMVNSTEQILKDLGIHKQQIKKDFFPGLV